MALHNLSPQWTAFIGREDECRQLLDLLQESTCRLLTLTGSGGIGKTRLGLEILDRCAADFVDGGGVVHLQAVESSDLIVPTIADAIGFTFSGAQAPRLQLLNYLSDKTMLLMLDNMEHLLDEVNLLTDLLLAAPQLKILVTSREALNLREEWLYPVEGLQYPDSDQDTEFAAYSAVQLFVACARRARADFTLEAQQAAIIQICRLTEGMPLALELAATWVRALDLAAIIEQIQTSIDFLTSTQRGIPARHQSMRAVFDTSWQLLSQKERDIFPRLAVFRGGFSAEAAREVAGASLQDMATLIDKSFVRMGDQGRYDLQELLRQYASEQLDQQPEARDEAKTRHSDYYTTLLHQQKHNIELGQQAEALRELDNVRSAWRHAVQQHNQAALLRAFPAMYWLYNFQNWNAEAISMFLLAEDALQSMPPTDENRFLRGSLMLLRCLFEASWTARTYETVDTALALWEGLDEQPDMGLPLSQASLALWYRRGEPERVLAISNRCLAFARRHDDPDSLITALVCLGAVYVDALGQLSEAQQLLEEALHIAQAHDSHLNQSVIACTLGNLSRLEGRYSEASGHSEASVLHQRAGGNYRSLEYHIFLVGSTALEMGDDEAAIQYFEECIAVAAHQHEHVVAAQGQAGLGLVAAFQHDFDQAAAVYQGCLAHFESLGLDSITHSYHSEGMDSLALLALLLGHYDDALAYYEIILRRFGEVAYRTPVMRAHSRIGHIRLGLGEESRARTLLFEAMHEAADTGAVSILLETLVGIAQLPDLPPALARDLFSLVKDHPATNRFSRFLAHRGLANIAASQESDDINVTAGHKLSLDAALALLAPYDERLISAQVAANESLVEPLSPRELDVLALMAEGLSNAQIAERLFITKGTTRGHINKIYHKLGTNNRVEVILQAQDRQLV